MSFASQRAALQAAIARDGLGAAEEPILGSTVPCFRILPDGAADRAPLGATRLGGVPDLPEGVAWPRDDEGRFANFFAQLDFADLAGRIDAPDLPREGLLFLFTTFIESAAKPVIVKTLVAPRGARLTRAQAPHDDDLADPDTGTLDPVFVRFTESLSLPFQSRAFRRAINAAAPDDGLPKLALVLRQQKDANAIGQLLGFATPYDDTDVYRKLYLHRVGRAGYEYLDRWDSQEEYDAYVARQRATGARGHERLDQTKLRWLFDHRDEIRAAAAQWRLLLRIDSNRPMKLNINDADPIYFLMPTADLANGDFSRMEAGVTQG
jgi:Domain of unknown function (DUF1963)